MKTQKEQLILLSYEKMDDKGNYLISGFLVNYPLELTNYSIKSEEELDSSYLKHFIEIEVASNLIADYTEWGMNYVSFIRELLQDSARVSPYETMISELQENMKLYVDQEKRHLEQIKNKDLLINSLILNNYPKI